MRDLGIPTAIDRVISLVLLGTGMLGLGVVRRMI